MKYLFLVNDDTNYEYYFCKALKSKNVLWQKGTFSFLQRVLFRLATSKKLPFFLKNILAFFALFRYKNQKIKNFIENDRCIVLVFRPFSPLFEMGYKNWLKKINPNIKVVWYYSDIIESYSFDVDFVKKEFDLILSFDVEDSQKYDLCFYPLVYSFDEKLFSNYPKCDAIFMGKAKNRLSKIIEVYNRLIDLDLKVEFFVADVDKNAVLPSGMKKIEYMDYYQYLQRMQMSDCIVEILQDENHHGWTPRTSEAIVFNKKLLSNNVLLNDAPFGNKEFLKVFDDASQIEKSFFDNGIKDIDYQYKEQLSYTKFVQFLEKKCYE